MLKYLTRKLFVLALATLLVYLDVIEDGTWIIFALIFVDDVLINQTVKNILGGNKWK